jgi:DNA-binding NtrC family response regulator
MGHGVRSSILIVDDKEQFSKSLAENLAHFGFTCRSAATAKEVLRVLLHECVSAILMDINLGATNGIDLLKRLSAEYRHIPVVMITGYASIETAVQSMKLGAVDYVQKPVDLNNLLKILHSALRLSDKAGSALAAPNSPTIITQNNSMKLLLTKLERIAATELPVLITGENGTGKELFVDYVHFHSKRNLSKFEKVNCAAFPESLLDNELFGHMKGAYTGADKDYAGVFERANGGSLFLDEISDMSSSIQAKILRTLQNNEVRRIGGDSTIIVDVRFISATNKKLEELIKGKTFREDLFYRVNMATVAVPPLRERREDIPLLIDFFIKEFCRLHGKQLAGIRDQALRKLVDYNWPGNVRELRNTVFYAATLTRARCIGPDDLPHFESSVPPTTKPIEDSERRLIAECIQRNNSNIKKTAEELHISRNTLYRKLKKYGLLECGF